VDYAQLVARHTQQLLRIKHSYLAVYTAAAEAYAQLFASIRQQLLRMCTADRQYYMKLLRITHSCLAVYTAAAEAPV
jgi:hypothetical protein